MHLSAGAGYFVDYVVCFSVGSGGSSTFLRSELRMQGSRLEHHSDVEVLTHPPDPLTM